MLNLAERAGYQGAIVVRNGIEGTIAAPLLREFKILGSARQKDGTYQRSEISLDAQEFLKIKFSKEEILEKPSLEENARLIDEFQKTEKTNNPHFDARVKVTAEGIKRALEWIEFVTTGH